MQDEGSGAAGALAARSGNTGLSSDITTRQPSLAHRFFGGPPLAVLVRLLFVSLVVGAILMWLDIQPLDVVQGFVRAAEHLWAMGFEAFGQAGRYILAGAVIVVPIWFVMRLLTMRNTR
jgi:hypothetical protein